MTKVSAGWSPDRADMIVKGAFAADEIALAVTTGPEFEQDSADLLHFAKSNPKLETSDTVWFKRETLPFVLASLNAYVDSLTTANLIDRYRSWRIGRLVAKMENTAERQWGSPTPKTR